ncbi:hypothetical protein NQ317_001407 [Molorchus minor]|uniref:Hexosyltransferase n=1 Tax=Molorchus minor TaxID=1323400 RepID=A0ABQ9JYW5_9CUCU|nr:hypothetical protein NQ317_001407 [Molorchus minor]
MDDDIVVNIDRIPDLLKSLMLPKKGYFLAGYILRNMKPIRQKANKWYVTEEEYNQSTYPQFVSGWFYVTTPKTCSKLYSLSQSTRYFWIDDTYITGILASKLKIRHYDISKNFTVHSEYLDCCVNDVRDKNLDCDILIGPNGGNNNLFYQFNNAMNICNLKLCKTRTKPLNETCVAEKKMNLGRGDAVVEIIDCTKILKKNRVFIFTMLNRQSSTNIVTDNNFEKKNSLNIKLHPCPIAKI